MEPIQLFPVVVLIPAFRTLGRRAKPLFGNGILNFSLAPRTLRHNAHDSTQLLDTPHHYQAMYMGA